MNKLGLVMKIINLITTTVIALVSLLFLITNIRLLFSGDISVYANPTGGYMTISGKIIMFLFLIFYCVFSYFYLLKNHNKDLNLTYIILSIAFAAIAVIYIIFNDIAINSGIEGIIINVTKIMFPIASLSIIMGYIVNFMAS